MNTSHDSVNPCTTLGHTYTAVTVVRCQHTEAWTAKVRAWSDNDTDEPRVHFEAAIEFGPFDQMKEIRRRVLDLLDLAIDHQRDAVAL